MYLTGFADEASDELQGQIKATLELKWRFLEARNVGGVNLHDLPDNEFDKACEALAAAGIEVNCFGSAIANWGRKISEPFDVTRAQIDRAIPRMLRLGTRLIRVMSYAPPEGRPGEDGLESERFKRLTEIVRRFSENGLQVVHENCSTWGGLSWRHSLRMLEEVPGLKLVFDTGNPVETPDHGVAGGPGAMQSAWEFYTKVRPHIAYVHIKDGVWDQAAKKVTWCFPGEGQADVKKILADLVHGGYNGGLSIEPHMAVVAHDPSVKAAANARRDNYVEYGRRLEALLDEVNQATPGETNLS